MLPDFPPEPVTLAVVYPHRKLLPAKVKAFADFMVEEVGKAVAAMTGRRLSETQSSNGHDTDTALQYCA